MKHVAEIRTGKNVQQVVLRSLQFATSQPEVRGSDQEAYNDLTFERQGPVYCWSAREISEEDLGPSDMPEMRLDHWRGSQLGALSEQSTSWRTPR